mmetsp:Transcript_35527/g.79756  ORF Transcript_35527/g.79756 Transcript_35527/m.79756 type:complete len:297 (-) Transcript_35527:1338-2228(-)
MQLRLLGRQAGGAREPQGRAVAGRPPGLLRPCVQPVRVRDTRQQRHLPSASPVGSDVPTPGRGTGHVDPAGEGSVPRPQRVLQVDVRERRERGETEGVRRDGDRVQSRRGRRRRRRSQQPGRRAREGAGGPALPAVGRGRHPAGDPPPGHLRVRQPGGRRGDRPAEGERMQAGERMVHHGHLGVGHGESRDDTVLPGGRTVARKLQVRGRVLRVRSGRPGLRTRGVRLPRQLRPRRLVRHADVPGEAAAVLLPRPGQPRRRRITRGRQLRDNPEASHEHKCRHDLRPGELQRVPEE